MELLRAAHRRELARSKEEMLELLASAEEKSLRVDEDSIRKKYVKEIDRIKVSANIRGGTFFIFFFRYWEHSYLSIIHWVIFKVVF